MSRYYLDITFNEQKELKEQLGDKFNCKFDSNILCWYTEKEPNGDLKKYLIKDSNINLKKLGKDKETILTGRRNQYTLSSKKTWMAACNNIFSTYSSCDLCDYKSSKLQNKFLSLNVSFKWKNEKEIIGYNIFCNDCEHRLITKNLDYLSEMLKISKKEIDNLINIELNDYKITSNELVENAEVEEKEELPQINLSDYNIKENKNTSYGSTKDSKLEIYVDGSHKKGLDVKGYGAYMKYNNKEYKMSENNDSVIFKELEKITDKFSNPSSELAGLLHMLVILSRYKNENIIIYQDYIGVVSYKGLWNFSDKVETKNPWEAKEPHIKYLVTRCSKYLKHIAKNNKIELKWIEGHSGIEGNEEADKLAKSGKSMNSFL